MSVGATVGKARKARRLDSEGKPMKRLVLVLSDKDYGTVSTTVNTRTSPIFSRMFDGDPIDPSISGDECKGKVIASICHKWLEDLSKEEK